MPRALHVPTLNGMPTWLKALLLAVALLVGLTFLAEALMATLRRQHAAGDVPQDARRQPAGGRARYRRARNGPLSSSPTTTGSW